MQDGIERKCLAMFSYDLFYEIPDDVTPVPGVDPNVDSSSPVRLPLTLRHNGVVEISYCLGLFFNPCVYRENIFFFNNFSMLRCPCLDRKVLQFFFS